MSLHPVTLPKWGLEMSEGLLSKWLVAEGTEIAAGTEVVDIETDKIVNTLDVERGGILARIVVPEGETVPVGALIAVISEIAASPAEVDAFIKAYVPIDASFEPKEDVPAAPEPAPAVEVKASPLAKRIAAQEGIDLSQVQGSGTHGKIVKDDVKPATPVKDQAAIAAANAAVNASPIARRFADAQGLDMSGLKPTGYKGRVSLADVQKAAEAQGIWQQPKAVAPKAAPQPVQDGAHQPFTGMRKAIARALTHSKQNIPHFYTEIDIEMDALMSLRAEFSGGETIKPSVNDFLMRATAVALSRHPQVNVQVDDNGVTSFAQVDLCMAVAIDAGLVTPVVRDAATKPVLQIAQETKALAQAARDRTLTAADLSGGTFTVSNLGMFGLRGFSAIINPPQGAILAVGGPRREARECAEQGVRFATMTTLTLSADHRAIDGAEAAKFLQTLKKLIEKPITLMM